MIMSTGCYTPINITSTTIYTSIITMITWVMFLSSSPCKLLLVSPPPPSSAALARWQSGIEVNAPICLCNQIIIWSVGSQR